jgi:Xaa-Pro dipeptidase
MGRIRTLEEWKGLYEVDEVMYVENAESIIEEMLIVSQDVTNGNRSKLLLMEGRNSDSGNLYKAATISTEKLQPFVEKHTLFAILAECRVCKSEAELSLLQHVTELTSFAHAYVMRNTKPGMYEYQSESLFRHYCYYNYGCRLVGYTPICGCGPNAAVLHYGHAGEPNSREIGDSEMCLYDMGAEYVGGYSSDVTCSFPACGKFTNQQAGIFNGVLNAQRAVYQILKPGVSWVDCHKAAEAAILQQLIEIGIVIPGDETISELVEMRLGAVFMPHGLGHFIGIDTHDVGGYLPGTPERSTLAGLKSLRTSRIIEKDMVLTVEPGCYFINHLLDVALDGPLREYLNVDLVEQYRGFGGVRLEDVIAITETGCINYTLCPRTISEIENVMAGGKWPPLRDEAPELLRVRLTDPTPLPFPPRE